MNRVDLEVWKILRTEASSSQNNIDKLRQHIEALRPETAFLSERIAAVKRNKSHHLSIVESYPTRLWVLAQNGPNSRHS
jgi:hypothetical protein